MAQPASGSIGIDFGGSACRIACWDGQGLPVEVADCPARQILAPPTSPERPFGFESLKRHLGRMRSVNDGGREVHNDVLAQRGLHQALETAEQRLGAAVTRAMLAVPSGFQDRQRAALRELGLACGLEQVNLIDDTLAAAYEHHRRTGQEGRWLVYSFGRSAFSCSVVAIAGAEVKILASQGDSEIGGDDLDTALLARVMRRSPRIATQARSPQEASVLLRALSEAKADLAAPDSPAEAQLLSALAEAVQLDPAELDAAFQPFLDRSLQLAEAAVNDSAVGWDGLEQVLLVGGTSRLPAVATALSVRSQAPQVTLSKPYVAAGAARFAWRLGGCLQPAGTRVPAAAAVSEAAAPEPPRPTPPAAPQPRPRPPAPAPAAGSSLRTEMQESLRRSDEAFAAARHDDAFDAYHQFLELAVEELVYRYKQVASLRAATDQEAALKLLEAAHGRLHGHPLLCQELASACAQAGLAALGRVTDTCSRAEYQEHLREADKQSRRAQRFAIRGKEPLNMRQLARAYQEAKAEETRRFKPGRR